MGIVAEQNARASMRRDSRAVNKRPAPEAIAREILEREIPLRAQP